MQATERIAQGLKEDEPVEKTTLNEVINVESSFKFLIVKQVFSRDPYRLRVHKDAEYLPRSPSTEGFGDWKSSTYKVSHKMLLYMEEVTKRSAIYVSIADLMVASVVEELSPKDERTKLIAP